MVLRILPVVVFTLLLPDVYIYWAHLRLRRWRRRRLLLLALPDALLLLGAVVLGCTETLSPGNMQWLGAFFMAYMILALPKALFALLSSLGRGVLFLWPAAVPVVTAVSLTAAAVLLLMMVYGTFCGPDRLQVTQTEFVSADLPAAFDGYRIVQLSDLHLISMKGHPERVDAIVEAVAAERPDVLVFTGDLVSTDVGEMDGFEAALSRLQAPDGVYSVLGNHDYLSYARYLTPRQQAVHFARLKERQRALGWNLLLDEHRVLRRGADSIVLAGVENYGRPPFPQRGDLKKALGDVPGYGVPSSGGTRPFKVLLSHDPTHWRAEVLPKTDIQLTLSGHTHGMQFMLFGWSPSRYVYPEWHGLYRCGDRALHVSLGLGGALIPFRFGAWPEINVITLRRK